MASVLSLSKCCFFPRENTVFDQIKYCHPIYYRYDPARFISDVRQNFMLFR
ncbi:hypothetical protein PROVALCAL_01711 [Providencia alcalifaciens DSM 30120]|uniref:Uncharacterized protein n=1 Tax=Providencia alcalifaciens DSM 30120 TaxID=520999 RepID=B6XED2_9GAMM|nr:hypothetical protein PROVALCAL_01711 [Providencia alcalifaciens DSM 30120]